MKLLLGLVAGLTAARAHFLWEHGESFIGHFAARLDAARAWYVKKMERQIKFGSGNSSTWHDVEADEVDLNKEIVRTAGGKRARWHQWAGLVQRGCPSSLVLFRTSPKLTKVRSPGPGPITKKDWEPHAKKFLKGRCVFLHTNGARSYKWASTESELSIE